MMTRRLFREAWPVLAAALVGTACKSGDATLLDLEVVPPGDECAAGGLMLHTGVDEDKDGVLDAEEVSASELVCSGETGSHGSVVKTTPLEPGDDCPFGGVMVEAGVDDGSGGGTAGDGVLQPGEVDSAETICNGEPEWYGESVEPPAGPAGQFTIDATGGEGTSYDGGEGGYVDVEVDNGTVGGGIRIFATGEADASFDYPDAIAYLGLNPLVVSSDLTVLVDPDTDSLADGAVYTLSTTSYSPIPRLLEWDDTAGEGVEVTGVSVEEGATLTLPYNYSYNDGVRLYLENDLHVAGTLTTETDDGGHLDLQLDLDNFIGESTGVVDLSGDDAPGGDGLDGGDLDIYAYDDRWPTEEHTGAIFSQATIDVSGGDGAEGGDAGDIELEANLAVVNAGQLTAVGGTATTGDGGDGGYITLDADYGPVFNSADMDVSGGDGVTSGGDAEDGIYIYNGYVGHVRNTGDLRADGGDISGTCSDTCYAGDGGYVDFYLYANTLITTGDLSARGGVATSTGGLTFGGDGGYVSAVAYEEDGWYADYVPPGDLVFSGNMDLSGGGGGYGGAGGYVDIELDADDVANNQQVILLGYTDIFLGGGDGADDGGDAEGFYLEAEYAEDSSMLYYGPGGAVVNYADVHAAGGDGTAGDGGSGGYFEMYTDTYYGYAAPWEVAINAGDVDLSGGGGTQGGDGGWAEVFGYSGVTNHGSFLADGGDGTDDEGGDADYYGLKFFSDFGAVVNSGEMSANGGDSVDSDGGDGGAVELVGREVDNSADLSATGGDGSTSTEYYGGDGGVAFLHSIWGTTSNTATAIEVDGGTGDTPGDPGEVFIDGVNATDDWD